MPISTAAVYTVVYFVRYTTYCDSVQLKTEANTRNCFSASVCNLWFLFLQLFKVALLPPESIGHSRELCIAVIIAESSIYFPNGNVQLNSTAPKEHKFVLGRLLEAIVNLKNMIYSFSFSIGRSPNNDFPSCSQKRFEAFRVVSNIMRLVCLSGIASAITCKAIMTAQLRCRRTRMSRYNVLMWVEISRTIEDVHDDSSSSETLYGLIAQIYLAYLKIFYSLQEPMTGRAVRSFLPITSQAACRKTSSLKVLHRERELRRTIDLNPDLFTFFTLYHLFRFINVSLN